MTTQAPTRPSRARGVRTIMANLATTALLDTGNLTASTTPAFADDYPSWNDVLKILKLRLNSIESRSLRARGLKPPVSLLLTATIKSCSL